MNLVQIEVIVGLPSAIGFQFLGRNIIEVHHRHVHLLANGKDCRCEILEFTLYCLAIYLIIIARCQGKKHRNSSFCTHFIDETASISTKGIYRVLTMFHLIIYNNGILCKTEFSQRTIRRTRPYGVDRTIIIMSKFEKDVVSLSQVCDSTLPKVWRLVESTWTCASKSMVFHRHFGSIIIFMLIISPSPLTIVTVTSRTGTHGGIAYKEDYGIITLSGRTGNRTCLICYIYGIGSQIPYSIDIKPYISLLILILSIGCKGCKGKGKC